MKIADRLKCLTMLWFICRPFGFCQKVQFGVPEGEFWNNQVGEWHVDMSNWHVKLDDMFLVYYLMKWRFERNPEAIFSLPNLHKVMSGVKVEQNENGTLYKYQVITLQYYEHEKESIHRNTTKHIDMILEALTEWFSASSKENNHGGDKSSTANAVDSILHDFCQVLDSQKWIVPEGMTITLEAMDLGENIESLSKIFDHFTQMFKKISLAITIETIIDE